MSVMRFVEGEYNKCSGMCQPSLFYLTRSVRNGIPSQGCVKPFFKDVSALFFDPGAIMLASGVTFLLMIFFINAIYSFIAQ